MSTLTSTSTNAEIVAAYMNNASYSEDASPTKAAAFVTSCRFLLLKRPRRVAHGGEEIELDMGLIKQELDAATRYLASSSSPGSGGCGVVGVSMEDFRT